MSDTVITILHYGVSIGFAVTLVALPFLVVGWGRYISKARSNRAESKPTKAMLFFSVPIVVVLILSNIISMRARSNTLSFLEALPPNHEVLVDGVSSKTPEEIVAALRGVRPIMAHHSHPTRNIKVEIKTNSGEVALSLGRDSDLKQEYWVFLEQPPLTSGYELGRITTGAFDAY